MKHSRNLSLLLAAVLVLSVVACAFAAEMEDNINGQIAIPSGYHMENNYSVVVFNHGELTNNAQTGNVYANDNTGLIATNNGFIDLNQGGVTTNGANGTIKITNELGSVTVNNGTVITNNGTVTANEGVITTSGGLITTNRAGGTVTTVTGDGNVTSNKGTVTTNEGTVAANEAGGVITTSNGTVTDNKAGGVITTNNGTVASSSGHVETNGADGSVTLAAQGTVGTNYGIVENAQMSGDGFVSGSHTYAGVQYGSNGAEALEQWEDYGQTDYTVSGYADVFGSLPRGQRFIGWTDQDGETYQEGGTYSKSDLPLFTAGCTTIVTAALNEDGTCTVNGAKASRLLRVLVDGELVEKDSYELSKNANGSLAFTFTEEFLSTLPAGEHTVKLRFTNGTCTFVLTV